MSEEIKIYFDEDGIAKEYDDTYDLTIHCESKKDHDELLDRLLSMPKKWIDADVLDKIKADLWMEGVNMTDEYQGVWVRYRDIERTIDKYKASPTGAERSDE